MAFRKEAYPADEGGWRRPPKYPNLPASMQIGPTLEELDAEAREKALRARLDAEVDTMVRCLHRATFRDGELVVEVGDTAEWVHLVVSGGTVELRRGDEVMTMRPGAIFGEEELLGDEAAGGWTRRCTAVARVAERECDRVRVQSLGPDPVVVVWQLRREVFHRYVAPHVAAHRRVWKKFVDSTPALLGIGAGMRGALADLLSETLVAEEGATVLQPAELFEFLVFVVDGHLSVRRADREVKDLSRFEMFLLKPDAPISDLSLKVTVPPTRIAKVPLSRLSLLPVELQAHLLKQARAYEAPPPPQPKHRSLAGL